MDLPRYLPKQRLAVAAWIAAGMVTIWLGLPPYHYKIAFIDQAVWIIGLLIAASGITALFVNRRPLIVVGFTLLGMFVGGAAFYVVWRTRHPEFQFRYGKDTSREYEALVRESHAHEFWGLIVGGISVPLVAGTFAVARRRSSCRSACPPGPAAH
jgi:F0F1-type ATP synthase assembly protein I